MSYSSTCCALHLRITTALIVRLAALLLCFAFSRAFGSDVKTSLQFVSDTIVPYAVQDAHKGSLLLEAKDLPDQSNLSPEVRDLGRGGPADMSVDVSQPTYVGSRDGSQFWVIELSFTKLPENEITLTRYLTITLNKTLFVLPYKIKTPPSPVFSWELNGPPKEWLAEDEMTAFSVKTGPVPAKRVRVVHSTLQDEETKRLISPADLVLCLTPDKDKCVPANNASVELPKGHLQPVFLRLVKQPPPGSYKGTISIGAAETDLAKPLELNVYVSSCLRKWTGMGAIVVGIVIAWLVNVYVATEKARLEAMRPAIKLAEDLRDLERRRQAFQDKTTIAMAATKRTIEKWLDQLTLDFLDKENYLPRYLRSGFQNKEKYEKHLIDTGDRAASLALIMDGIEYFRERWDSYTQAQTLLAEMTTLAKLDGFAEELKFEDKPGDFLRSIGTKVQDEIEKFKNDPSQRKEFGGTSSPWSVSKLTLQSIDVTLLRLNLIVWLLWALVTALAGWAVLIQPDPGFGTGLDLLKSFLWGLGVLAAGQGLQQLTPNTVMTSFSLSYPSGKK